MSNPVFNGQLTQSSGLVWFRSPRGLRILALAAFFVTALIATATAVGVVVGNRHSHSPSLAADPGSSSVPDSGSGSGSGSNPTTIKNSTLSLTIDLGYASYTGSNIKVLPPGVGNNRSTTTTETVSVNSYLGMRYAAPPTANLRWRAPIAPTKLTGSSYNQSANSYGPVCMGQGDDDSLSEDCLFVNVWAPANNSEPKPVWVWIQGGGYIGNSSPNFNGTDVIARSGGELVYVNFNYRVGIYGFLAGSQVADDGDLNVGLLDQRFLLQWVRANIAQFGGDPDRVVIHGASAGAGSTVLQSLAYGGRDDHLFVGLIAQSVFLPMQPTCDAVEYKFNSAANLTGCTEAAGTEMDCLRSLSITELQSANQPMNLLGGTGLPNFYWGPCVDGEFLEDRPYTMYQDGRFLKVPMMFGTTTNEAAKFVPDESTFDGAETFMINNYPGLGAPDSGSREDTLASFMLDDYYLVSSTDSTVPGTGHQPYYGPLSAAYGEITFICGQVNLLTMVAANYSSVPVYAYRYNMQDPSDIKDGLGTIHVVDTGAIFGPDNINDAAKSYYGTDAEGNPGLVPLMMDYYISFILNLNPNDGRSAGAPTIDEWTSTASNRLVITSGSNQTKEVISKDLATRCNAWLDLADITLQ